MSATTLGQMVEITGKEVLDYLDRESTLPIVTAAGAQGDVLIVRASRKPAEKPMPACVVAVASEASSNTHTLHPYGECFWEPHTARRRDDVLLGVMTVPEGSQVFVSHQEHGGLLVEGGRTYEVHRQQELGRRAHGAGLTVSANPLRREADGIAS